jgi:trehalose 2-sulfotransferase
MLVAKAYVICATPRSGSTLLCDLLENTGVAGRPASYFRSESIPRWGHRLNVLIAEGCDFGCSYIDAVVKEGRGGTDIFGFRLMRESVDELSMRLARLFPGPKDDRARFETAFGPMLFIHLSRTDKVSQAVSRVKAMQTGLWHVASDGTERERTNSAQDAVYDRDRIGKYVQELTAQDQAWTHWFVENRIEPVRLTYEALSRAPKGALEMILSALGLDSAIAAAIEPKTTEMSDFESQNWVSRFRDETDTCLSDRFDNIP